MYLAHCLCCALPHWHNWTIEGACSPCFFFPFFQMRELESSIPDTLHILSVSLTAWAFFFLNKDPKLNDSSCQTKVWKSGDEGRGVLMLGTRDGLKGWLSEKLHRGGNPVLITEYSVWAYLQWSYWRVIFWNSHIYVQSSYKQLDPK